jgi:serine/threonine protein kinase
VSSKAQVSPFGDSKLGYDRRSRTTVAVGQTISQYRILEKLGEGGIGVIYQAEDIHLGRTVALKSLAALLLNSDEHERRFLREARPAVSLDHPNLSLGARSG